jgi:hypothetical protein
MMSDAQFATLISVIGVGLSLIGAAIKWAVGRLVASLDKNTEAHLTNAKAMTEMSTKLDFVYNATGKVDQFMREEVSAVHDAADETPRMKRERTPVGRRNHPLYPRAKTNPEGDE